MHRLYCPHDQLEQNRMASWTLNYLRPTINSIKDYGQFTAIAVVKENTPLAVVVYNNYIGHDIHMTIASSTPKWATRGVLRGLFDYPFNQAGCARVTACTRKGNKSARTLLEKAGFTLEGNQRKGYLGTQDMLYYGMLREECKWLT